jgi:hypothetical protein
MSNNNIDERSRWKCGVRIWEEHTSRVVGEAKFHSISWKLMGVGSRQDNISGKSRISDLCDNVFVGEPHNKSVLGSVVLVLILGGKADPGAVVGLSGWQNVQTLNSSMEFNWQKSSNAVEKSKCARIWKWHTSSTFVLDLEPLEVLLALLRLHESLQAPFAKPRNHTGMSRQRPSKSNITSIMNNEITCLC